MIELATTAGQRRLKLGPEFRVERSAPGLHAELDMLLGKAMMGEEPQRVAASA